MSLEEDYLNAWSGVGWFGRSVLEWLVEERRIAGTPDEIYEIGALADDMLEPAIRESIVKGENRELELPHPLDVLNKYEERIDAEERKRELAAAKEMERRRAAHLRPANPETVALVERALRAHGLVRGQEDQLLLALAQRLGAKILPPQKKGRKRAGGGIASRLDDLFFEWDIRRARQNMIREDIVKDRERFVSDDGGAIATALLRLPDYQKKFGDKGGQDRLRKRVKAHLNRAKGTEGVEFFRSDLIPMTEREIS